MGCRVLTCDSCQTRKQFSGMHYTAGRRYCGSCLRAVGVRWAKDVDNDLLLAEQEGSRNDAEPLNKRGVAVECAVCGHRKSPRGPVCSRLACTCAMTTAQATRTSEPWPATAVWPGESEAEFGYSVADDGTTCEHRKERGKHERACAIGC